MTQAGDENDRKQYRTWHYLVFLAVARGVISASVARSGLVALSDDDYARVTIAQRFASHPRLDPSGSSWLPFPFWVMGSVLELFDTSLETARSTSAWLAILATWLLFAAGRLWGFTDRQAFWCAVLANLVPATAVLGSVTVPEYPTAALGVFALVAATSPRSRSGRWVPEPVFLAGVAMVAATLSRYEAWPVAGAVAVVAATRRDYDGATWKRLAATALPLLGPAWWLVHNHFAHGHALAFLARVSSYRAALGLSSRDGAARGEYWMGLVGGSPAVVFALAALVFLLLRGPDRAAAKALLRRFRCWAIGAGAVFAFLVIGESMGGAPTHHPERALLIVWLLAVFAVVDLVVHGKGRPWLLAPVLVLLVLDYRQQLADPGVQRGIEEIAGMQLHALVGPAERVFIATEDYGYFAIIAAFGRPFDTIIDQSHDPRDKIVKPLLSDRWNAVTRLKAEGASWLVAPSSAVLPMALSTRSHLGTFIIFEVERGATR